MQVTNLFSGYVGGMLGEHAANPAQNWKAKDCALYLVTALTVRGRTAAQGATTTNQLVNISDFFNQQVCLEAPCPYLQQHALSWLSMSGNLKRQRLALQ